MRIGFDVSQTAENKAGCGFVADQLIRALVQLAPQHEYLLYPSFYGYQAQDPLQATCPESPQVRLVNLKADPQFDDYDWWRRRGVDRSEKLGYPDVIHSNNFSCPLDIGAARRVMTVYDLSFLDLPEATTEANRLVCFQGMLEASVYADHLLMISAATRDRFLNYFPHYPRERTSLMHLGNRPTIREYSSPDAAPLLRRLGVGDGPFWLGVGTVEPRKNYQLLINAYAEWLKTSGLDWPLYIAGGRGWLESPIYQSVTELGLTQQVHFLGYVSDAELSALYSSCFAFVFPSLYEGFGLPVLEAMSCGAPVIVSHSTSLPEVAGEAGFYIDPACTASLCRQMQQLTDQSAQRERWRQASRDQARGFSWDKAAHIALQAYETSCRREPWYIEGKERR